MEAVGDRESSRAFPRRRPAAGRPRRAATPADPCRRYDMGETPAVEHARVTLGNSERPAAQRSGGLRRRPRRRLTSSSRRASLRESTLGQLEGQRTELVVADRVPEQCGEARCRPPSRHPMPAPSTGSEHAPPRRASCWRLGRGLPSARPPLAAASRASRRTRGCGRIGGAVERRSWPREHGAARRPPHGTRDTAPGARRWQRGFDEQLLADEGIGELSNLPALHGYPDPSDDVGRGPGRGVEAWVETSC